MKKSILIFLILGICLILSIVIVKSEILENPLQLSDIVVDCSNLCYGDANGDLVVSSGDYASVQANFGNTGEIGIMGDANKDGVVSAGDYASVMGNFGNVCNDFLNCVVTWQAEDIDGDDLFFDVYYSNNDVDWDILSSEFEESFLYFPTDGFPGGNYKLKISATDGLNSVEALSESFFVDYKEPFSIIYLEEDSVFEEEIFTSGLGYDIEDGYLTDENSLTWFLDQELISSGEYLYYEDLEAGEHEIKLRVTDSDGNSVEEIGYFSIVLNLQTSEGMLTGNAIVETIKEKKEKKPKKIRSR